MHIVFLGNCQANALAMAIRRFVSPYEDFTTDFVDAYSGISPDSYERLRRADTVVAQATHQPPRLGHEHIPPGAKLHLVPTVDGSFLYPYQGEAHPAGAVEREGHIPFMPEYSDRYLSKLYLAKVSPADALADYRAHNVAAAAHVGRRYEIAMDGQRRLDDRTGYACADLIETHLTDEQLFQSAYHFDGRIARRLAAGVCDRLGFAPKYGQRIRDFLAHGPFVPLFVPIHPSVAKFFGMTWLNDDTRYRYRCEGAFTFDEYVLRYMEVRWSETLQEGVTDAQRGKAGAKAKLEAGLLEAPESAEGAHELSRIVQREGNLKRAIELQRRAVAAPGCDASMLKRLGELLLKVRDLDGAERAFRRATELDPVDAAGWCDLRDVLIKLGRFGAAIVAARKAFVYAKDQAEALDHVVALEKQLASGKDLLF